MGADPGKQARKTLKVGDRVEEKHATMDQISKAHKNQFDKLSVVAFIVAVKKVRFQKVDTKWESAFLKRSDRYADEVVSVYKIVTNWKKFNTSQENPIIDRVSFAWPSLPARMGHDSSWGPRNRFKYLYH